jgi:hypothetical protein
MTRPQHAILPFVRPCPPSRCDARCILEVSLPPSDFPRTIILECHCPEEVADLIEVRVLRLVGAPFMF